MEPVPPAKPSAERKKKPSPWEQTISDEVVELTNGIFNIWPNSDQRQPNGTDYVPRSSRAKLAARLTDLHKQGVDLAVCWEIAKKFKREFYEGGMWAKAAENFFGKVEDAPWIAYYQAYQTMIQSRKKAEAEAGRKVEESPFEEVS